MNLNGEQITHKAFGQGQIVEHEDGCVTVLFSQSGEKKRFIYPSAVGTFLKLDDAKKAKEFKAQSDALAKESAMARQEEADRQLADKQAASDKAKKLKKTTKKPPKKAAVPPDEAVI